MPFESLNDMQVAYRKEFEAKQHVHNENLTRARDTYDRLRADACRPYHDRMKQVSPLEASADRVRRAEYAAGYHLSQERGVAYERKLHRRHPLRKAMNRLGRRLAGDRATQSSPQTDPLYTSANDAIAKKTIG